MVRRTRKQYGGAGWQEEARARAEASLAAAKAAEVRRYELTPQQAQEKLNRIAAIQRNAEAKAVANAEAAAAAEARKAELNAIRNAHKQFSPANLNAEVKKLGDYSSFSRALKKMGTPVVAAALRQKVATMSPSNYNKIRDELRENDEELANKLEGLGTPMGVNAGGSVTPSYMRYNADGYNQDGYNIIGRNRLGYNRQGLNVWGQLKPGQVQGESNEHYKARLEQVSKNNKAVRNSYGGFRRTRRNRF